MTVIMHFFESLSAVSAKDQGKRNTHVSPGGSGWGKKRTTDFGIPCLEFIFPNWLVVKIITNTTSFTMNFNYLCNPGILVSTSQR